MNKAPYIEPYSHVRTCEVDGCDLNNVVGSQFCVLHIPTKQDWENEMLVCENKHQKRQKGWVYFVLAVGSERIKIGKTTNPKARMGGMKTDCPFPLLPLVFMKSEDIHWMERLIHEALGEWRCNGEWFEMSDEVIELMITARDKGEFWLRRYIDSMPVDKTEST